MYNWRLELLPLVGYTVKCKWKISCYSKDNQYVCVKDVEVHDTKVDHLRIRNKTNASKGTTIEFHGKVKLYCKDRKVSVDLF